MKLLFILLIVFYSCSSTTVNQDIQNLQKHYKIVYKINISNYIVVDSSEQIYHIQLYNDTVGSKVHIK